jgi:uncharacterized protein with PIN domain
MKRLEQLIKEKNKIKCDVCDKSYFSISCIDLIHINLRRILFLYDYDESGYPSLTDEQIEEVNKHNKKILIEKLKKQEEFLKHNQEITSKILKMVQKIII